MKKSTLLASIILPGFLGCGNHGEFERPLTKPLMEAVYASGYVVAEDEYQAFSQVDGYIVNKLVNDGDAIRKNDPLYIIEADQQNERYRIAKENYELAQRNFGKDSPVLAELQAIRASAKTKMQYDSVNLARYSNLLKQNATSKAEYDRMQLLYENSSNEYKLADSRYEKIYNQLKVELKNAESQYNIVRDESARYTIRSQVDGAVFKTFKGQGELVRRTEVIAVLGKRDAFYLQLTVDELDIQRVKVGQPVLCKIDAYPDRIFNATISRIYPLVDSRQQALRVDANLHDQLPGAFSGLALEANIVIRKAENTLVIPKQALLPGDSIIIRDDRGESKIKIKTGITTFDEVEVVEGLTPSSLVKVKL